MFLVCNGCATKYKLNPAALGVGGRMVRCTECGSIWFQPPLQEDKTQAEDAPLAKDSAAEESLLDQIGFGQESADAGEDNFANMLGQRQTSEKIPDVVVPSSKTFSIPVVEYRPMGMGAGQFGMFIFLLLCFFSASILFVLRQPLTVQFPAFSTLYAAIGMPVRAPGEGLRLSELAAGNTINRAEKALTISAKIDNISKEKLDYPPMRVTVFSHYGAALQEWDIKTSAGKTIVSGESVPIKAEFKDPPDSAVRVQLKVIEP